MKKALAGWLATAAEHADARRLVVARSDATLFVHPEQKSTEFDYFVALRMFDARLVDARDGSSGSRQLGEATLGAIK